MLSRRVESVMIVRRSRLYQLGCFARFAVLAVVATTGCKPTQNPQQNPSSTVVPRRETAPVPSASALKATAPVAAIVEPRQEIPINERTRKCEEICRIPMPLHCSHQEECVSGCESMAMGPICKAEVNRMYDCLLRQPVQNWECDENGVGAIRDPFCDKEQAAAVKCIEANAGKM